MSLELLRNLQKKEAHIELHTHPVFKEYGLEQIIKTMDMNRLDVVALSYLDKPILSDLERFFPDLKNKGYLVELDEMRIKIIREEDYKKFNIIPSLELNTSDNFHFLFIGHDKPPQKPLSAKDTIELGLENKAFVIFDHPFVDVNRMYLPVKKKKREEIEKICREYSGRLALEWNAYCKALYWQFGEILLGVAGWRNVNKEAIRLSKRLKKEGYNVPVIADTDLHAKTIEALETKGRGRIITQLDHTSGRTLIGSMTQNVFSGNYKNVMEEVSTAHFIAFFVVPYISQKFGGGEEKEQIYHIRKKSS